MKGCRHKKRDDRCIWCDKCAQKIAGAKPNPEWKHGDYAYREDFGTEKVLDSEVTVVGHATETPSWSEYLIFRNGGGTASLFRKVRE